MSSDARVAAVDERDGSGTSPNPLSLTHGSAPACCGAPDPVRSATAVLLDPTSFEGPREQRKTPPPLAHGHHLTDALPGGTRGVAANSADNLVQSVSDLADETRFGTDGIRSILTPVAIATGSQGFGHKQSRLHWDDQMADKTEGQTDGTTELGRWEHWADTVFLFLILPDVFVSFRQMLSLVSFTGTAAASLASGQVGSSSRRSYRTPHDMRIGPLD